MFKAFMLPLTLIAASALPAACLADAPEIGDTGPGSEHVRNMLASQFRQSEIRVIDRKIHSGNSVSVLATVDGRVFELDYELVGFDWILAEPIVAARD